jgi:SHS2 domain-containing protein
MGHYVVLEDIALADCALDIEGADLADLFETAARALAELMVDPATLPRATERTIRLEATGLDLLLFDWLSELIYRKDRDREAFPETHVRLEGDGPVRLIAVARGGVIDPARTSLRADPKAVTFHQFALTPMDGAWRARVVIDI